MTPQRLIMLIFFLQALPYGSWLPRIPEIQERLGLDHAMLAVGLIGFPVGTLLMLPFAGRLATRFGSRVIIMAGFVIFLVGISLPGWAVSLPTLFLALMVAGTSMSLLELGLNVAADEIEKQSPKLIMSTCHGFWSLGVMAGSLIAAGFIALQVHAGPAQTLFAALLLPVCLLAAYRLPLPSAAPAEESGEPAQKGFRLPHPVLIGICVFVVGIALTEGAAADWSAVFLRDIHAVPIALAGLGYTLFALMVTVGRFLGDRLKHRFGAVVAGRTSAAIGVVGCLLVVFSSGFEVALIGFAALGFGVSIGFPLAVTAAAEAPGISPARNMAVLTFAALSGFLAGPPVIGFISHATDLRIGLAILAPALVASAILAVLLRSRRSDLKHAPEAPVI